MGAGAGRDPAPHVRDNETVGVTPPHDGPVPHGNLCIKSRFGYQHVRNRERPVRGARTWDESRNDAR